MTRRDVLRLAAFALATACVGAEPEAIAYDADGCAYCRMTISDPRFSAELVTAKGRTVKFDSIDCLVAYYKHVAAKHQVESVWVANVRRPGAFIDAHDARFIDVGGGRAPMGGRRGLAAVATDDDAASLGVQRARSWAQLL